MKQKSVKDLEGYPFKDPYTGDFTYSSEHLTSLEGCPNVINGHFYCSYNKLQSLQYCPQVVKGGFYCHYNNLQSLQNIHKYCKQIDVILWAHNNPIKSHVLGVMLIENLQYVILDQYQESVKNIINTHLETDRDVYLCQDDLIKTGFVEYAQL
jgi:hypothetical protein